MNEVITRKVPTLEVAGLRTHFFTRAGVVKAVDDVSLSVAAGDVLGLVGESGSGKTITGFSILGLVDPPGRVVGGSVKFKGEELIKAAPDRLRHLRGNRIAMIFQDPMMTLNPVLRVDTQIIEAIQAHRKVARREAMKLAAAALADVGISSPERRLTAYPHELSGGMRQRVAIAIAFINAPDLVIADEPTTALDVTIQAQILHLAQEMCRRTGTAMIWITHDLAIVSALADRIAVMYAGRIVEMAATADIVARPRHPYTRGLLGSVPTANRRGTRLMQINGNAPSLLNLPAGCAFRPRCAEAGSECAAEQPMTVTADGRQARCCRPLQVAIA